MAGLQEQALWDAEVYQIEQPDPVVGGPPNLPQGQGIVNVPHQALANRTAWLKSAIGIAVPAGMVAPFAMRTPPTGWLECNGATISRVSYAGLFANIGTGFGVGDGATTFRLPDLRGEFLRGWDNGRGVDSGRGHGSFQDHALQDHNHQYARPVSASDADRGEQASLWSIDGGENGTTAGVNSGKYSHETRPRNVALTFCIRY
jgi:microcystin-dependent protein